MTVYRHGNKFRTDVFHDGQRVARRSFDTRRDAEKWEKLEGARQLLSEEERYRRDVHEWAKHHRFVEKPEYMRRIEEHGTKSGLLNHLTEFADALPAPDERYRTQPPGSMIVYVPDPVGEPETVELKPVSTVTLKEALEQYRDKVTPTHKESSRAPETIKINKIVRDAPALVKKKIAKLGKADFNRYRDERLEEVKPGTVKVEVKLFRRVINWARDELGVHLVENPAGKIRFPNGTDVERDRRLLEDEEARLLEGANPRLRDIITIALDTAMREGEIVQIDPKWFRDFGTPRAHLRLPTRTKTDKPRSIPLTKRAEEILTRLKDEGCKPLLPIKAKTVCKKFIALTDRLEIEDLRFHDLRHEALSRFAEKGFSTTDIMKISGHRSLPMALRYHHPNPGNLTERLRAA